jgi:hypothetical protein
MIAGPGNIVQFEKADYISLLHLRVINVDGEANLII